MTWVAVGVTAAGTIYSGVSGAKAGKAARQGAQSQQELMQQDLAERQRIARHQEGVYGPLEEQAASLVSGPGIDPLRAGVIRARVGNEYNAADRNILTMIGNRGVSSGLGASLLGASQMNRARSMASGILGEYQNKDQARLQLLNRYNPLQTGEFQSQGLRGLASFYGDEAARARAAEQQGYQGMGQGIMNMGLMYAMRRPTPPSGQPSIQPGLPTPIAPQPTLTDIKAQPGVLPQAPGSVPTPWLGATPQPFGVNRLPSFSNGSWGVMPNAYNFGRM